MTAVVKRRLWTGVLAAYWLTLFVATHIPRAPEIPLENGDKLVHFSAYAMLALLAAACWSCYRPLKWRGLLLIVLAISVYGALDELTQIPVGRTADWRDWVTDVLGAGAAVYAALQRGLRR
jgi:VanZ family protein